MKAVFYTALLAAFLSTSAFAEDVKTGVPGAAEAVESASPGVAGDDHSQNGSADFLDDEDYDKIDKMTTEERDTFFKERREKFKSMTVEEREVHKQKRKEWFAALPPEKQEKIKARHQKFKEMRKEKMKEKWEKMTPEEREAHKKKRQEHFDSMPPEKKEMMKKKMEGRRMQHMDERKGEASPAENPVPKQ